VLRSEQGFQSAEGGSIRNFPLTPQEDEQARQQAEANEARRMLEDSESDSDDSDDPSGGDKKRSAGGRQGGRSGEKPSEDHVEKLEEKLEAAQADQKNLFLIIFQVNLIRYSFPLEINCITGKLAIDILR